MPLLVDRNPDRGAAGRHLIIVAHRRAPELLFGQRFDRTHAMDRVNDLISDLELHTDLPMPRCARERQAIR